MDKRLVSLEIKSIEVVATRFAIRHMRAKRSMDICPLQSEVLIILSENGGSMTQKALLDQLEIRKSTLSGIIDTMIRNGFVERSRSSEDQRVNLLELTDKGREEYESALSDLQEVESILCENIDPEDVEAFFRVTDSIRRNIDDTERQR